MARRELTEKESLSTKTEYREYIAGPEWRGRRRQHIEEDGHDECSRCGLPRWLAIIAFDQDLHVHHRSYARLGSESEKDLESLCRRCHEFETFGESKLHQPRSYKCRICEKSITWNQFDRACTSCFVDEEIVNRWHDALWVIGYFVHADEILEVLAKIEKHGNLQGWPPYAKKNS